MGSLLAGCGGSGGSDGGSGGPGGGTAGNGGALTSAQRYAAMDAVNEKLNSLAALDPVAQNQQILTFIKSRPEFASAELSENGGSITATFTDGQPYVVINNLGPQPGRASNPGGARRGLELPKTTNARMMNSLGPGYPTPKIELTNLLAPNYHVISGGAATVDELKAVSGDGIFYLDAHGAVSSAGTTLISTGTVATDALDKTYLDDFSSSPSHPQRLMRGSAPIYSADNKVTYRTIYCITPAFVRAYMKFGANSLVIFNTCESRKRTDMRDACFDAGASVFGGWTEPVDSAEANETALFLFDRLLGSNEITPEDPPQRAFDYSSIATQMANRFRQGKPYHLDVSNPKVNFLNLNLTYATFHLDANPAAGKGDFGLLNPSIRSFVFNRDASKKLYVSLSGAFGTTQGQVSLGGANLTLKQWTSTVIDAYVPEPVAAADLVVTVNGRASNAAPVTRWDGKVHLTQTYTDQGSLTWTANWNLSFLGDARGYRLAPGDSPSPAGSSGPATKSSTATYTASGSYTDSIGATTTWSGGGSLTLVDSPVLKLGEYSAAFTLSGKTMTIDLYALAGYSVNGGAGSGFFQIPSFEARDTLLPLKLTVDNAYNISAGSTTKTFGDVKYSLTWDGFKATNPPTDSTARSVTALR